MKKFTCGCGAFVVLTLATLASSEAATLEFHSRFYDTGANPAGFNAGSSSADFLNAWNALAASPPTVGYGDTTSLLNLTNINNPSVFPGGANSNLAYLTSVTFNVNPASAGNWTFRFGADASFGGTLLVDGVGVDTRTDNAWAPNDYFEAIVNLTAGPHTVTSIAYEDCCDGGSSATYKSPLDADFLPITTALPEPTSIALLGLGTLVLVRIARRRKG